MSKRASLKLIGLILLCESAGILGAVATQTGSSPWYQQLNKPSFNPPGWVFGPVWTVLYLMMGVAAFLVLRLGWDWPGVRAALATFAVQLVLNAIWTPVFFGLHSIGGALAIIIALWLAILACIVLFWRLARPAALLLMPYLLWVSFATVLNAAILSLN